MTAPPVRTMSPLLLVVGMVPLVTPAPSPGCGQPMMDGIHPGHHHRYQVRAASVCPHVTITTARCGWRTPCRAR